jgi:hypothetical protein
MLYIKRFRLKSLLDGWMDGWVDGWMGGKAGLRIAYSNQKLQLTFGKLRPKILLETSSYAVGYLGTFLLDSLS